ncbi:MAG: hypothetical protein R6U58_04695 [Bacteroidales bacterium]
MEKGKNNRDYKKTDGQKISRKEAIKKAGYAAFSAATMMLLLNEPAKGQQFQSDTDNAPAPLDPFDEW